MSNVVNTKYGDRGLVHLPPVTLDGSRSPSVKTLAPTAHMSHRSRNPSKVRPPATQSTAITRRNNYQPQSTYRSNWQSYSVVQPAPQQSTQPPVQQTQQFPVQQPVSQYPVNQFPATQYAAPQYPVQQQQQQQQQPLQQQPLQQQPLQQQPLQQQQFQQQPLQQQPLQQQQFQQQPLQQQPLQQQQQLPGNLAPNQQGTLNQLVQQAQVPTMQGYNYGQYPMVNGAPTQMYPQYTQQVPPPPPLQQQQMPNTSPMMPAPSTMYGPPQTQPYMQPQQPQPPPPPQQQQQQCSAQPYQQPQYGQQQQQNPQEKHIFYGPDGQVLPGPPAGFAYDGSHPRDPDDFPQDFAIEGVLDYGRLRAVQLMDNTKRFPKIPEYLHKEMLVKYKQYSRTFVRIVSRGGEVHVHATPFVDRSPRVLEEAVRPQVRYEYVPIYVDENDDIVEDPRGYHRDDRQPYSRGGNRDGYRDFDRHREQFSPPSEDFRRRREVRPETDDPYFRHTRHGRSYDSEYGEPYINRSSERGSPRGSPRTVVNAMRPRRQELPSFDY